MGITCEAVEKERRTDHKGIVYGTEKDMCKAYGLNVETYRKRVQRGGWTKEKALETPVKEVNHVSKTKIDHMGNAFSTVKDMCKYWGVSYNIYVDRLKRGCSLEDALKGCRVKDHLGKSYRNESEMYRSYGISSATYQRRKRLGWNLKRILTEPVSRAGTGKPLYCVDHIGNKYKDSKEMLKHYGVSLEEFRRMISEGYTLEQALTANN